jgi:hypothetical protein
LYNGLTEEKGQIKSYRTLLSRQTDHHQRDRGNVIRYNKERKNVQRGKGKGDSKEVKVEEEKQSDEFGLAFYTPFTGPDQALPPNPHNLACPSQKKNFFFFWL